jgi:uncharacterized protein YecT (DUF1311 family)
MPETAAGSKEVGVEVMRRIAVLALFGLLAAIPPAVAAECNDQSNQMELDICADQDFRAADKALNETYGEIVKRLSDDSDGHKRLSAAQKAWIAFRDAECDFQAGNSIDGSIYPMLISMCRTGLTQKRTTELKAYLDCEEGDTLCPVPAP